MNKDFFEQVLRDQLQSAEADVPANAWASIKSQIGPSTIPTPPSSGGFGMTFGLVAGASILVSLATYSTYRTSHMAASDLSSEHVQASHTDASEKDVNTIQFDEADKRLTNEDNEALSVVKPTADIAIVQKAKSSEIVHDAGNTETPQLDKVSAIAAPSQMDKGLAENRTIVTDTNREQDSNDHAVSAGNSGADAQIANNETSDVETGTIEEAVESIDAIIGASEIKGYTPMKVKFDNLGEGLHYEWNFGSYGTRYEKSPEITFDKPGTYNVYLTVSNDVGDVVTDLIQVKVKEGSNLSVPNTITPNGDGLNDSFKVEGYLIESFWMIITNENGDTVFETTDINQTWNYDQTSNASNGNRYYVTYRGIGVDGKKHTNRIVLNVQQ